MEGKSSVCISKSLRKYAEGPISDSASFFVDLRPTMLDQSGIYEYIKVNVGIRRLGENGRREKEKSIFLVFNLQNVATQDYLGKYDFRRYRG